MPDPLHSIGSSLQSFFGPQGAYAACRLVHGAVAIGAPAAVGALALKLPGAVIGGLAGYAIMESTKDRFCPKPDSSKLWSENQRHQNSAPSPEYLRQALATAAGKAPLSPGQTVAIAHAMKSHSPDVRHTGHAQLIMPQLRQHLSKTAGTA